MSKTELILQKLLNVSLLVTITTFTLLIIDLFFAVLHGAIDCSGDAVFCTISAENAFYKGTLWTLFSIMMVFLIAARVIYTLLQRESKLVDVSAYRKSLVKKEETAFSKTKIYSDIIKTKKSRYTDTDTLDKKEEIIEEETIEEDSSNLRDRIKDIKLPFFAKRNLENSLKKEEKEEPDVIEPDETSLEKVSKVKKDNFFTRFLAKLKNINWLFWKKEKNQDAIELEETVVESIQEETIEEVVEDVKVKETVTAIKEVVKKTAVKKVIVTSEVAKEATIEKPKSIAPKLKQGIVTKTKSDIIQRIYTDSGISKNKSNKFLGTFSKVITEELSNKGEVELEGIGLITTILMPSKEAINPQTKQRIIVDAHHQVRMRFSEEFKTYIAENSVVVEKTRIQETIEKIEPVKSTKEETPIPTPEVLKEEVIEVPILKPSKPKIVVITKTKAHIIEKIFEDSGLSKNKSNKFLGTFSKVITEELANKGEVELEGIGLITTILMPSKEAINPQTKQRIIVDAHHQVRLRFSDEFKKKFE